MRKGIKNEEVILGNNHMETAWYGYKTAQWGEWNKVNIYILCIQWKKVRLSS